MLPIRSVPVGYTVVRFNSRYRTFLLTRLPISSSSRRG